MADTDKKRKYLLFSKDDGRPDHLKPCAFFISEAGCRNGSKCKFSHGPAVAEPAPVVKEIKEPKVSKPVVESAPVKHKEREYETKSSVSKPKEREYEVKSVEKKQKKEYPEYSAPVAATVAVKDTKDDEIAQLKAMLQQQQAMFAEQLKHTSKIQQAPPALIEKSPKVSMKEKGKEIAAKRASARPSAAVAQPRPEPFVVVPPPGLAKAQPVARPPQPPAAAAAAQSDSESDSGSNSDNANSSDDEGGFLFDAVNVALKDGRNSFSNQETISIQSRKALASPYNTTAAAPLSAVAGIPSVPVINGSSASMFLPTDNVMKTLQTSGSKHATHGSAKKNVFANPKTPTTTTNAVPSVSIVPKAPSAAMVSAPTKVTTKAEVFDPANVNFPALAWSNLVQTCQSHNRFKKEYSYEVDSSWVTSRPVGDWSAGRIVPAVIAIDCEMCETADPVTGAKENSLIRLSIVNGLTPAEVLIDCLVVPANPITDMRAHIHGITEDHLKDQKFTLRQAQAFLYNLCSDRTIIVGHSVHNDLKALHFQHHNIIDTSYLYTLENEPNAAASVRDISEQVLGVKLAEIHDSIQDARSALYVAAVILIHGPHKPLQRTSGNMSSSGKLAAANSFPQLLVHRIPDFCTDEHILEMMVQYTKIVPAKVHPITRGSGTEASTPSGKAVVQFASQQHADLAFDSIVGPNRPDKQNRSQKRIYLKGGGYICVRK